MSGQDPSPHDPAVTFRDRYPRLGKYELLTSIGQGGMAEVFLARQQGPRGFEKVVVLKCIYPHLARRQHFVDMFLDEARIAANINDPNVVHIYELGEEQGTLFLAMEYLVGESLSAVIKIGVRQKKLLDPWMAARIVANAASGLHTAHELVDPTGVPMEVVHRDVSPGNIVVLYNGAVKVVDFGVAKARGRLVETTGGELKGKFAYMSPEQLVGKAVDRRSDIFSLGVVLWETLAHTRLFRADSQPETVQLILQGNVPPPSRARPEIPVELDEIAMRALEKNPANRFQTADELRLALENYLSRSGMPASRQDLARWMEECFPERIAWRRKLLEAASKRRLDAMEPFPEIEVDLGSESTSLSFGPTAQNRMELVHAEILGEAPKQSSSSTRVALVAGIVGIVLAAVVGGVLWWWTNQRAEVEEADTHTGPVAAAVELGIARVDLAPPDARLLVDGKEVPAGSPAVLEDLEVGEHTLSASAPGFEPGEKTITVTEGDVTSATLALTPKEPASLKIVTKPKGATVEVDGVALGVTPFSRDEIRPELERTVRLVRDGYGPVERFLSPKPGETVTMEVTLEPLDAGAAASKGGKDVRPAGKGKKPEGTPATPAATGTLFLRTKPWSVVYLGKKKLGETPLAGVKVPAGVITLRAENPDSGLKKTFKVTVEPDGTTRLNVDL